MPSEKKLSKKASSKKKLSKKASSEKKPNKKSKVVKAKKLVKDVYEIEMEVNGKQRFHPVSYPGLKKMVDAEPFFISKEVLEYKKQILNSINKIKNKQTTKQKETP